MLTPAPSVPPPAANSPFVPPALAHAETIAIGIKPPFHLADGAVTFEVPGFKIERLLGVGGYGVVLKAIRLEDAKPVALKIYKTSWDNSEHPEVTRLAAFRRESRTLRSTDSPHVVKLLGEGFCHEDGKGLGHPYIALELVSEEGMNLRGYRERVGGKLTWLMAERILRQVCSGMCHLHERGIVWGDATISNVLVSGYGTATLSDFGHSDSAPEPLDAAIYGDNLIDTTNWFYRTPEEFLGRRGFTFATDVWKFGVICYELLHSAESDYTQPFLKTLRNGGFHQLIDDCRERLPWKVPHLVERALLQSPSERFENAMEIRRAFGWEEDAPRY